MIRDDAQFVKKHKYPNGKNDKSYQSDTPIKQAHGSQFLTVPILHKKERFLPITKTEIAYELPWVKNHLLTLKIAYSKSPNFSKFYPYLEGLLMKPYPSLAELNISSILWGLLLIFEEDTSVKNLTVKHLNKILQKQKTFRLREIRRGSESAASSNFGQMSANEKILALLDEVGANEDYCGGTAIAAYFDHDLFEKAGIKVTVQDWKCKEYRQQFIKQQSFIPNLSILDLVFNATLDETRAILSE